MSAMFGCGVIMAIFLLLGRVFVRGENAAAKGSR
jgi:hypothetical protein